MPVLDIDVAAGFLVTRTDDADRQAAEELALEFGGLPLALEQAAAYVQASGVSLAGYLALFRQRRADVLGRGEPIGYRETVGTAWRLAFEDLRQAAPGAAGLLRLLAFCAPEAIPLRLLVQAVTADQMPADLAGQWRVATAAVIEAAVPARPWIAGT